MLKFLSKRHEERFKRLLSKDNTSVTDLYRLSLFYVLSGSTDIWGKGIDNFYNFSEHGITPNNLKKIDLCTSSKALINLAFNLYNGYSKYTLNDIFKSLDADNAQLALNAIEIRYFVQK